jgi:hypothetical protein
MCKKKKKLFVLEASNGVGENGQGEIRLHVLYSPHIKVRSNSMSSTHHISR